MKGKYAMKKTTALFCVFSILLTMGMAGCGKETSEKSKGESSAQSQSVSASSESSTDASSENTSISGSTEKSEEKSQVSAETSERSAAASSEKSAEKSQMSSETSERSAEVSSEESSEKVSDNKQESPAEESNPVSAGDFTYITDNNGNITMIHYNGKASAPEIPSTLDGKPVTAIGESCFAGNFMIEDISIPEGVTEIGDYAFECCSHLEKLKMPESLKVIGEGAFSGCKKMTDIDLPDNVEVIKKGAFLYCVKLTNLSLPTDLNEIGNFAFARCSSLKKVTFRGSGVKDLPDRLFYYCKKLSEVNIQHTLNSIGKRTFAGCKAMESISLSGELQSIGDFAFENCDSLSSVSIQAAHVSETAYNGCYNLPQDMLPPPEPDSDTNTNSGHTSYNIEKPDKLGSIAGDSSLFDEEKYSHFREISNDEFSEWSQRYIEFCRENDLPVTMEEMFYTMLYKGETEYHYIPMAAVESHDPVQTADAVQNFGDDFEEMYLMINHGLYTELKRGKMCDDLVLYSGVYDSQLRAAAGTDETPTPEQLRDAIGKTFTDPIMISTSTDINISSGFSSTIFIIYASKEKINELGAVSIDSISHSNEKEVLMSKNATYRILDVGTMELTDSNEKKIYRNYVKVELI